MAVQAMAPMEPLALLLTASRMIVLMVAPVAVVKMGTDKLLMTGKLPSLLAWAVRVPVKLATLAVKSLASISSSMTKLPVEARLVKELMVVCLHLERYL